MVVRLALKLYICVRYVAWGGPPSDLANAVARSLDIDVFIYRPDTLDVR